MKNKFWLLLLLSLACLLSAWHFYNRPESIRISGNTMGTTYNIIVNSTAVHLDAQELKKEMEVVFADVNAKMSNWDKNSEVSRFNKSRQTSEVEASQDFISVLKAAEDIHKKSNGKFDITLAPLINLWGFGPRKQNDPIPSNADIQKALSAIGQSKLLTIDTQERTIKKSIAETRVNLSAIAKGFGIDAAAAKLSKLGYKNYMVEIGGDLRASGTNDKGESWRIGVEKPEPGSQSVEIIVPIKNAGMATSGDYRNFVEHKGVRYSHILDPATGYPITHRTTSVTVIAKNAMLADGWATALLTMGAEDGLKTAEKNKLAVYFISREQGQKERYIVKQSSAFKALIN